MTIIFDSECLFCNKSIQWIFKNDPHHSINFAGLNSFFWQNKAVEIHFDGSNIDSVLVLNDSDMVNIKTKGLLMILKKLQKFYLLQLLLWLVPTIIADIFYDLFAKNRKKISAILFKNQVCEMPSKEFRERILA